MSHDTEGRLSAAMRGAVGDRPYAPDLDQIQHRGRQLKSRRTMWRAAAGGTFAVAAIAAVAVSVTGTGTQAPAPQLAAPKPAVTGGASPAPDAPLVQLVGYLTAAPKPTGDATLLLRDQVYDSGLKVDVWDLHADNGDYYFAKTKAAMPGQVRNGRKQSDEEGRRKAVAAAKLAAKGDLNDAREKMANAYLPKNPKVQPTIEAPGVTPTITDELKKALAKLPKEKQGGWQINSTDNWVWNNSMDALRDGAGDPLVRAGVLRLLGQMPEVKVERGTVGSQPVLKLTAGKPATVGGDETLTVNADTGLPIKYASEGGSINYTVTRVTIADVAKGKF
ncbi:hypothetical protein GCM10010172_27690 [Paractinoplanes ferrugineus]|uniref:CU044_5270 family protein n=1 Tax=Paractinoplanes ferrugineus TaxID=113564 RepID=A0A919ISP9_9ACTN|nr:hypothetical protein [Actinoplanes ferrugineus]GIE08321.1 hypothetical protein Afe05nite_01610 [Actinoplanes ferrugineus]